MEVSEIVPNIIALYGIVPKKGLYNSKQESHSTIDSSDALLLV